MDIASFRLRDVNMIICKGNRIEDDDSTCAGGWYAMGMDTQLQGRGREGLNIPRCRGGKSAELVPKLAGMRLIQRAQFLGHAKNFVVADTSGAVGHC